MDVSIGILQQFDFNLVGPLLELDFVTLQRAQRLDQFVRGLYRPPGHLRVENTAPFAAPPPHDLANGASVRACNSSKDKPGTISITMKPRSVTSMTASSV